MNKRDIYIEKAQARLDEQLARLDQLKARMRGQSADGKLRLLDLQKQLDRQVDQARKQLGELRSSAEEAFEDGRGRLEKLSADIAAAFRKFTD